MFGHGGNLLTVTGGYGYAGQSNLSISATWAKVGDLAVLAYHGVGPTGVTSTNAGPWTEQSSYLYNSNQYIGIWTAPITAAGADTINVTDPGLGTNWSTLWPAEVSSYSAPTWTISAASNPPGYSSSAFTGTSSTITWASLTPAGANNAFIGLAVSEYHNVGQPLTPGLQSAPINNSSSAFSFYASNVGLGPTDFQAVQSAAGGYFTIGVLLHA